jgi:hypothetical protein
MPALSMIDENAFGILLSYFTVEDDEYGLEREEFVARFQEFRATVRGALSDLSLGNGVRAIDLGHAFYVEVGDGDQTESPLAWAKQARARLTERGFETVAVVTHGGRWVEDADGWSSVEPMNEAGLVSVSLPSEPFRRALYADAASRHAEDEEEEEAGWGPGLYLDVEAVEALRIKLRNLPTSLRVGSAEFYRVGV